jgi:hypothetical protein
MTALDSTVHVQDHAVAYVAGTQIFNIGDDDFIEMAPIPLTDLAACADGRFLPPGGQWADAHRKLREHGSLIVTGERGTGRRTAALHLLSRVGESGSIHELTPQWKRPRIQVLQPLAKPGAGYLLDMSDPTDKPAPADFGKRLMDWARQNGICLVVIAADDTGARRWAGSAGSAEVRLLSPNARDLAAQELRAAGIWDLGILGDEALTGIWESGPKVDDTRRLVRLIVDGPDRSPKNIADEYQGWQEWLGKEVPAELSARTLLWAAAFCNGGQRKSVLRMAEELRRKLGETRSPSDILSDYPVSTRLREAKLDPKGKTVWLPSTQHGLAGALRSYLWDEFDDPKLREFLTQWLVAQLAELPPDDAERVAYGVLDVVVRFRDDTLLRGLRDGLSGEKRSIAVRTLSDAALNPEFGAHVRASLYKWARSSGAQADLVADVCGSIFGQKMPGLALVRLGWAAQNSKPDSPALAAALVSIAENHTEAVLSSIEKWFADYSPPIAGLNAFLALASTEQGARLLCARADPDSGQLEYRKSVIDHFQRSLANPGSYEVTISVLETWKEFSAKGVLDPRKTINLLGKALEPEFGNKTIMRLHPGTLDLESFWGQVFTVALTGNEIGEDENAVDEPADSGTTDPGQVPEASHDVSPVPAEDPGEAQPVDGLTMDSQHGPVAFAMPAYEEPDPNDQAS